MDTCILPDGWTIDTFMEPHNSRPYNPETTYDNLVEATGVSRSTIKRAMGKLTDDGHIKRVGGKRYGHWEIRE